MDEVQTLTPLGWMGKKTTLFVLILVVPTIVLYSLMSGVFSAFWYVEARTAFFLLYPTGILTLWSAAYAGVLLYHIVRRVPAKLSSLLGAFFIFWLTWNVWRILLVILDQCGGWAGFVSMLDMSWTEDDFVYSREYIMERFGHLLEDDP